MLIVESFLFGLFKGLGLRFRDLMKWFGKKHGEFKLHQGDFTAIEESKYLPALSKYSVIFANNFMYGEVINNKLAEIFMTLNPGN